MSKKEKQFDAFMQDLVAAMHKHKVENMLVVFCINDQIRNTCLSMKEEVAPLYANLSDGIDSYLKLNHGYKN